MPPDLSDPLRHTNQKGMVLLVTLAVVTILLGMTVAWNLKIRQTLDVSTHFGKNLVLSQISESGLQAAMALLARDRSESEIDSVQEFWADPDRLKEVLQDLVFENGALQVSIQDELGKISINALVSQPDGRDFHPAVFRLWQRLLENTAYALDTAIDSNMILNSMKDWMDSGDADGITGLTGAESDFYRGLNPPYPCKNGPVDHPSELLRIRGFTDILYHGSPGKTGIANLVTAIREETVPGFFGKININTADPAVLAALLPPHKTEIARDMAEFRTQRSGSVFVHDLSLPIWYKQVPGMEEVVIPSSWITLSSDVFRIRSVAAAKNSVRTVTAVVVREKDSDSGTYRCRVLYRESDF